MIMKINKYLLIIVNCLVLVACQQPSTTTTAPSPEDWSAVVQQARGQTVYWHAWGGSPTINSYIQWVGDQLNEQYGITLQHVKVSDTANVVSQVLAEKTAGKDSGGSVDLIWLNGENFKAMKNNNLLYGPFAEQLPNFVYVDTVNKPTVLVDFTEPTEGYESPWGMAQLNFIYDSAVLSNPPTSMRKLLEHARNYPGRITYPAPPDYMGSTFLKQVLYETIADPTILQKPVVEADFAQHTRGVVQFLDEISPHLWQRGANYPRDSSQLERLLADNEVDIAISFNPGHASEAILAGRLPPTVRTYVMEDGTIGNSHFVAIPYNANAKAAAMVTANFLVSPLAQARKEDAKVWGDPTVLAMDKLNANDRKLFDALELGPATLTAEELGRVLPEPHSSWVENIEKLWLERYAN